MKILRMMLVAALCVMLSALGACSDDEVQGEPPSELQQFLQSIEAGDEIELTPMQPIEIPEHYLDPDHPDFPFYIPETVGVFELSAAERAYYDEYILTGDHSVLAGVEPLSVLKIWMQAGIDGNFEREFNLYHYDTLDGRTLEAHLASDVPEIAGSPAIRQRWANVFFSQIDGAEFVEHAEDGVVRGDISFYTEGGELIVIGVRQNDAGIWLIERQPF